MFSNPVLTTTKLVESLYRGLSCLFRVLQCLLRACRCSAGQFWPLHCLLKDCRGWASLFWQQRNLLNPCSGSSCAFWLQWSYPPPRARSKNRRREPGIPFCARASSRHSGNSRGVTSVCVFCRIFNRTLLTMAICRDNILCYLCARPGFCRLVCLPASSRQSDGTI